MPSNNSILYHITYLIILIYKTTFQTIVLQKQYFFFIWHTYILLECFYFPEL